MLRGSSVYKIDYHRPSGSKSLRIDLLNEGISSLSSPSARCLIRLNCLLGRTDDRRAPRFQRSYQEFRTDGIGSVAQFLHTR